VRATEQLPLGYRIVIDITHDEAVVMMRAPRRQYIIEGDGYIAEDITAALKLALKKSTREIAMNNAIISACGQYRYTLSRDSENWATGAPAVFLMLNPSTADAMIDDPTIRRCRKFSDRWGMNGIVVVNLYALRSTDPAGLWEHKDPVGPANDAYLLHIAHSAKQVICAWGANARQDRVEQVVQVLRAAGAKMLCLGVTKQGMPKHPLYIRGDQPLTEWIAP
jgi:hypothetical protein